MSSFPVYTKGLREPPPAPARKSFKVSEIATPSSLPWEMLSCRRRREHNFDKDVGLVPQSQPDIGRGRKRRGAAERRFLKSPDAFGSHASDGRLVIIRVDVAERHVLFLPPLLLMSMLFASFSRRRNERLLNVFSRGNPEASATSVVAGIANA